jgi:hypothetical protein
LQVIIVMLNRDHIAGGQIVQYVVQSEIAQFQRPVLCDQTRARVEGAVWDLACLVQELQTLRDLPLRPPNLHTFMMSRTNDVVKSLVKLKSSLKTTSYTNGPESARAHAHATCSARRTAK